MTESNQPEAPTPPQAITMPADTITRYAVYNTELGQFVGGVYVGDKPKADDIKAMFKPLGMEGHKYEVRKV